MKNDQFILSVLVSNIFSVLTRVAGLFARRGFNIDSLNVGETDDPKLSRMSIIATGDEYTKNQIIQQLRKLHDVKSVVLLEEAESVVREHVLIKMEYSKKAEIDSTIGAYEAKILNVKDDVAIVELVGSQEQIDAFVEYAKKFGIIKMCRAGALALAK